MLKRVLPLVTLLFIACVSNNDRSFDFGFGDEQFENYCVGVDCGSRGRCAVGAEGPICICDPGYTVQDEVCKKSPVDDPCAEITCDGNGVCAVVQGKTAVCLCRTGYHSEGATCVEDEVPRSPCAGITCGGYGSCVVTAANKALCICDQGYQLDGNSCVAVTNPCEEVD